MKIFIERAKTLDIGFPWVYFCLRNPDIMNDLTKGPLRISYKGDDKYKGSIFGVYIKLEVLGNIDPEPEGEVDIVSDVVMPMSLGKTYTVAHWRYRALDNISTLAEIAFALETRGPIMSLYALVRKRNIDSYLDTLFKRHALAAQCILDKSDKLDNLLTSDQLQRIMEFRKLVGEDLLSVTDSSYESVKHSEIEDSRPWVGELTELTSLYQKYQGRAMEIEEELIRIRDTRDSVATLLTARRMLELIVARVCKSKLNRKRGSEPLTGVIDKLRRGDYVPEYIITSMNNLNRLSLFGAHPKKFTTRQVREALMAMCSILEWYVENEWVEPVS